MQAPEPHIITYVGLKIPVRSPKPQDIQLRDIAHHLAMINLLGGASMLPYTAAQHAVITTQVLETRRALPSLYLLCLLYHAHVAYLGHMPRPVERAIWGTIGMPTDRDELAEGFDIAIRQRFSLSTPTGPDIDSIKAADNIAFATAWRDLMPDVPCPSKATPASFPLKAWPWSLAEQKFLATFERLSILAGINTTGAA